MALPRRKQAANAGKLRALVDEIEVGAVDPTVSTSNLLRQCLRLASELESNDLELWARAEISGYRGEVRLPDYRTVSVDMRGDYSGPFGSGYRNAPVPSWVFEEHELDMFATYDFRQPLAEIEDLLDTARDSDESTLKVHFPPEMIALLQRRSPVYEGHVLASGWQLLSGSTLSGIVDMVRTKALDFVLQIGRKLPSIDSGEVGLGGAPAPETVSQIVNTTIYGASNVAIANHGDVTQVAETTVLQGDFDSLATYLGELGLGAEVVAELEQAIRIDQDSAAQPGPTVESWIGRVMSKIGMGSLVLAGNASGSIIAEAILRFLGLAA